MTWDERLYVPESGVLRVESCFRFAVWWRLGVVRPAWAWPYFRSFGWEGCSYMLTMSASLNCRESRRVKGQQAWIDCEIRQRLLSPAHCRQEQKKWKFGFISKPLLVLPNRGSTLSRGLRLSRAFMHAARKSKRENADEQEHNSFIRLIDRTIYSTLKRCILHNTYLCPTKYPSGKWKPSFLETFLTSSSPPVLST